MKINSNIIIFIILTLFVASNALLYTYLNDGYFIDKKATIGKKKIENIIFTLISDHEKVLNERNSQILLEAQLLRDLRSTTTDSEELKAIEEKLKALEDEAKKVQDSFKSSENERRIAEQKSLNEQLQFSELLELNSEMGAQLENLNEEFNTYVNTIKDTLKTNSYSEKEIVDLNRAFNNKRGLDYVNRLVENIQEDKLVLVESYTDQLLKRSNEYHNGLKKIAGKINKNYSGILDDNNLLETEKSIIKFNTLLESYIALEDQNLNAQLQEQKDRMLLQLEEELAALSESEEIRLQEELTALEEKDLEDKLLSLEELEKRLREELKQNSVEKVVENTIFKNTPTADSSKEVSWVHIPTLWKSDKQDIIYTGKKIDSIAWSRNVIGDNQAIYFDAKYTNKSEFLVILYGNGRFKSWKDGLIISITDNGINMTLNLSRGGIDDNAELLLSEKHSSLIGSGISGEYGIIISNGLLTIVLNGKELLSGLKIEENLNGRIGFGNRESVSSKFEISNFKLFEIK